MAQLDRLLAMMVSNRADFIQLTEDDVAQLSRGGALRPITKNALSATQILGLIREIAPAAVSGPLEAGRPVSFSYTTDDGAFVARVAPENGRLRATLAIDDGAEFHRATIAGLGGATAASAPAAVSALPAGLTGSAAESPAAAADPPPPALRDTASERAMGEDRYDPAARAAIDRLLRLLVERSASDLHLRVGEPPILRTHGEMMRLEGAAALQNAELESMLASIMPERNKKEFRELNDTDYAYEIAGVARFRANALRDRKGAAAVFRVIPATVVTVEQMGISQEVQNLCYLSKGLVLVTGPTGSGKSTTLCALVDLVNRVRSDHVITIEDPIEFVHPNKNCIITQRQVGVHTTSFKSALRAALREDPDIVLVGELRDLETVAIAIETAETGHLVFGTLHTTTAASTIDRLIDQFPADRQEQIRIMLSESLKGVISQTLCRKIGGGRVAAREILLTIPAVSNLIREAKTFQIASVMQTSKKIGMITLNDALIDLVDQRLVEPKEAYIKAIDKASFVAMLRGKGHDASFLEGDGLGAAGREGAAPAKPGATPPRAPAGASKPGVAKR